MKPALKHALAAIILILSLAAPVAAGPLEDAKAAYSRGDYATALRLWRPLANQGDAGGQLNLGFMYDIGRGVPQNYVEAAKWYRLAADQGNAIAQNNLGRMYFKGLGVPQNHDEAAKWYRLAADQGNAIAQNNLGWMYSNGRGVPQDYAEALKWYRLSANQGFAARRTLSGVCTATAWACRWITLARTCGSACRRRRAIKMLREIEIPLQRA